MDEPERQALRKQQTDDIYRAIGRFSVKFEQLVQAMTFGIVFLLSKNGLKNQQLAHVMMADLTAYPIKSIFGSMIAESVVLNDRERRIVDLILKRVQGLIDKRNDIVHSTWSVGWAATDAVKFDTVGGYKLTRGRAGARAKSFTFKSGDFDKFSLECDDVKELVYRLWRTVLMGRSIVNDFVILDSGEVAVPSKDKIRQVNAPPS